MVSYSGFFLTTSGRPVPRPPLDKLGAQADTDGTLNSVIKYTAFGEIRATQGITPTKYRYTGQLAQAELGLDYYVARWYDPVLGHFTQADTLVPEPGKSSAYDRYAYVQNNPIRYKDPSGHDKDCGRGDPGCKRKVNKEKSPRCITGEVCKEQPEQPTLNIASAEETKIDIEKAIATNERIGENNSSEIIDLLIPSHYGVRLQIEISIDIGLGISGTIGVNGVYNRISDELVSNVDWSVEPGVGIGGGGSATGGLLVGWGSSNIDDATKGNSVILSGTAAAEAALSVAVSAPIDNNDLHVDPKSSQVPFTAYFGSGAGGAYAGIGGGLNGQTGLYTDLSSFLPWKRQKQRNK